MESAVFGFDGSVVIEEVEIFYLYASAEIEINLYGVAELGRVYRIAFEVFEFAYRVHRIVAFEAVDTEDSLLKADFCSRGRDHLVDVKEVSYRFVGSSYTNDVGFENRPRVFHEGFNDVRKTESKIAVFVFEVVTHIAVERRKENVFTDFELGNVGKRRVIEPYVAEFLDRICGAEAYVVCVNIQYVLTFVRTFRYDVELENERAPRSPRPSAVIEYLFTDILVVNKFELDSCGFGKSVRRIVRHQAVAVAQNLVGAGYFTDVAHKRAEQVAEEYVFRRSERKFAGELAGVSHYVFEFVELAKIREYDFDLFTDVLGFEIETEKKLCAEFVDFFLTHLRGGIDVYAYRVRVYVVCDFKIRFVQ